MKNLKYRIYGRSFGRNKNNINLNEYKKIIKNFKINNINKSENNILDIGTGYGETTIYLAKKHHNYKIFACEKYVDGNLNLIKNIKKENLENISIHHGNVHEVLDSINTDKYFNSVCIFFPDPWPKKKHHKRRLISDDFIKKIFHYIKSNGKLYIATDSTSYLKDIFVSIYSNKSIFEWENQCYTYYSLKDYFNVETKYYKKAIKSGIIPTFLVLKKL